MCIENWTASSQDSLLCVPALLVFATSGFGLAFQTKLNLSQKTKKKFWINDGQLMTINGQLIINDKVGDLNLSA